MYGQYLAKIATHIHGITSQLKSFSEATGASAVRWPGISFRYSHHIRAAKVNSSNRFAQDLKYHPSCPPRHFEAAKKRGLQTQPQ